MQSLRRSFFIARATLNPYTLIGCAVSGREREVYIVYGDMKARENDFSRTLYNKGKMGYYPTDPAHCDSLAELFKPSGYFYALDPGAGDMTAMLHVVDKKQNPDAQVCGVELNPKLAEACRENPDVFAVVEGDFTQDLMATPNAFDFVFTNPAYLDVADEEPNGKAKRLEMLYLERLCGVNGKQGLMKKGAILVLVVNLSFFSDRNTVRFLMNRFDTLHVWRFRDEEYAKFHQVVFVGRRSNNRVHLKDEVDAEAEKYDSKDKFPVLPVHMPPDLVGSVEIPHSSEGDLKRFTSNEFDYNLAAESLLKKPPLPDYRKWLTKKTTQNSYAATNIEDPPIMPGLGNLFMEEVCGVGNGKTGDRGKDEHLARGIVDKVSVKETVPDEKDHSKMVEKITTMSKVKMKILEIVNEGGKPKTYLSTLE